jgi:hypothetical protein
VRDAMISTVGTAWTGLKEATVEVRRVIAAGPCPGALPRQCRRAGVASAPQAALARAGSDLF